MTNRFEPVRTRQRFVSQAEEDRNCRIRQLRREGYSYAQIGSVVGLTGPGVRYVLSKMAQR